jgi:hypothetical protein
VKKPSGKLGLFLMLSAKAINSLSKKDMEQDKVWDLPLPSIGYGTNLRYIKNLTRTSEAAGVAKKGSYKLPFM